MQYHIVVEKSQDKFGPYTAREARKRLTQEGFTSETRTRWKNGNVVVLVRPVVKQRRKK